jgi:phosphoglycolate phosphatase
LHTLPDLVAGANGMLCTMGFLPLPAAKIGQFVGKGAANLVLRCLESYLTPTQSQAMHARALAAFEREYDAVNGQFAELFPGVIEGLDAFKAKGLRLAVVTNKPCQFAFPLLQAKGLTGYFDLILGGDSLPQRKPDPAPMLHVAQQFGLAPNEILAIGDSSNDAMAARAAGMPVFLVPYGYNHGEPIDQSPSNGIVSSIAQAAQQLA